MSITLPEAQRLVADFAQRVQVVDQDMARLAADAAQLSDSQQAFHQALGARGADLDRETVASVGAMSVATGLVEDCAREVAANQAPVHLNAVAEALDAHNRLMEEIGAQDAGQMPFYDPE